MSNLPNYCIIDVETASDVDIENGVLRYVTSDKFHILSLAYKIGDGEVVVLENFDRAQKCPLPLPDELKNFDGLFVAHNWFFEFICLNSVYFKKYIISVFRDVRKWVCTASLARYFSVDERGKLEVVAERMGLPKKLQVGKSLIDTYSRPNKYGKFEIITEVDKRLWIEYNKRDVEITAEIFKRLYPLWPPFERKVWEAHKAINLEGVPVDIDVAQKLKLRIEEIKEEAAKEAEKIAGRTSGGALVLTSQKEFLRYLNDNFKLNLDNVRESTINKIDCQKNPKLAKILELRKILSSRSIDKTEKILQLHYGRKIYDSFVYCGAVTGRWASWGVNFLNFSREDSPDDDEYEKLLTKSDLSLSEIKSMQRGLVRAGDYGGVSRVLIISDFRAIELHLLLYCAEDKKQLEILESGKSLYSYFGEKAFGKKVEKGTKEYQIAKSAVLGLGYGAGANVFAKLANIDTLTSERVYRIWRENNYPTTRYWSTVYDAFFSVAVGRAKKVELPKKIIVAKMDGGNGVKIVMPNGFEIFYPMTKIENDAVLCSWDGGETYHRIWGGLLTENIMQSLCRQLLADSLINLVERNLSPILHVYDEIVCEVEEREAEKKAKEIAEVMTAERAWLPNFKPQIEQKIAKRWRK